MSTTTKDADERTPLLNGRNNYTDTLRSEANDEGRRDSSRPSSITPLPWPSVLALCFCRITEPIAMLVIFPFLNESIARTGVPVEQVGYRAGMIESIFTFVQFCTILQWSRLSDRIGRKPVILMGLSGCSMSVFAFGLSKSVWAMVVARSIAGLCNGNIGIVKSSMAEMTDETNEARAFALLPMCWTIGQVIAPVIGGYLANPVERYPAIFGGSRLFEEYRYLLPCLVAGAFPVMGALIGSVVLKETLARKKGLFGTATPPNVEEAVALLDAEHKIPSLREVLTPRVRRALLNYAFMAFIAMAINTTLPLFMFTPIRLGGLGFTSAQIGKALSGLAIAVTTMQITCFAPLQARYGSVSLFRRGAVFYPITCALSAVTAYVARREQSSRYAESRTWTWLALAVQLGCLCAANVIYTCNTLIISAAAPRNGLGTLNGAAQTMASLVRSVCLAGVPSLFALTIEKQLLGGQAIWLFMTLVGCGLLGTSWLIEEGKAAWRIE